MIGTDFKVAEVRVRRTDGDLRPEPNHLFVIATVTVANRTDASLELDRVPAVFVAVDGTEHDPLPRSAVSAGPLTVEPFSTATTSVYFDVARMKAVGGTVRIRPDGDHATGPRLHLAS